MLSKRFLATLFLAVFAVPAWSDESATSASDAAQRWRRTHEWQVLDEYLDFLRIPNESKDRPNLDRNAQQLVQMLKKRGLSARLLEHPDAAPLVYGEQLVPGATSTFVFYGHYDGQPATPKDWASPPFEPTVRSGRIDKGGTVVTLTDRTLPVDPEWRVYARGSADDKGGIMALLAALEALKASGIAPRANLKFVFEGEEETGSAHLESILEAHKSLLQADLWIICDTPVHASGRQNVVFGARGVKPFDIIVHGASRDLHSGQYGNWAPNPAMQLAQLLATLKDAEGRVLVEGFYDGVMPLTETERNALDTVPDQDAETLRSLGLSRADGGGARLVELHNLPTLNIRGLSSGRVGGQVATIIPATATAAFDIRLVKGISAAEAIARVTAHVRKQGFFVTTEPPDEATRLAHPRVAQIVVGTVGYEAVRTSMDSPVAKKVVAAVSRARDSLVLLPTTGGSLPLDMIERALGSPAILIGSYNADNNQHAKDENLRLQNLWDAIGVFAELLVME